MLKGMPESVPGCQKCHFDLCFIRVFAVRGTDSLCFVRRGTESVPRRGIIFFILPGHPPTPLYWAWKGRKPHRNTLRPGDVQILSIGFLCLLVAHVARTLSPPWLLTTASYIPISISAFVTLPFQTSSLASIPRTMLWPSSHRLPMNLHRSLMNKACTPGTWISSCSLK